MTRFYYDFIHLGICRSCAVPLLCQTFRIRALLCQAFRIRDVKCRGFVPGMAMRLSRPFWHTKGHRGPFWVSGQRAHIGPLALCQFLKTATHSRNLPFASIDSTPVFPGK